MLDEQSYELSKKNLLSERELEDFLLKVESLYKKELNIHYSQNSATKKKEITDKLKSLFSLKQEYEALGQEIREYEEMLGEANEESSLLEEDFKKTKLGREVIRAKVVGIIISEAGVKHNCIIEIRPGIGGVEAGLFARDLFRMYYKFTENKRWKLEILENRADSLGNLSFISFLVKGESAFSYLKNEAGIHRVQRIPLTENKGRIQTSTTSVVVLPEVDEVAVKIESKDTRIDTYRSSGAGGQHVNTTDSAIRITHLPTGIYAVSQDGRSQHDNKEKAFLILRGRLFEKYKNERDGKLDSVRSSVIGNSERAEKIRTYNYPQNRVTDHRIGLTINKLNSIIEGSLDELSQKLIVFENRNKIINFSKMLEEETNK